MANTLRKITWKEAQSTLALYNPELTQIINQLNPPDDLMLYEASYEYGIDIDNGDTFFFPDKNNTLQPLSHHSSAELRKDFNYAGNHIPIGIVSEKCLELFVDTNNIIIPSHVFYPGEIFALSVHLEKNKRRHPTLVSKMSSGCRSCFSLPNISDNVHYMQLKRKLNLKTPIPKSLYDQGVFFRAIAQAMTHTHPWEAKVILFPQQWVERIRHDRSWQNLYCHLIELSWTMSSYLRNKIFYDYSFDMMTSQRNIKPNPYVAETFKYIIPIALGEFPGLRIAADESALPLKAIQEALVESYGLKHYIPTIFHATHFDYKHSNFAIYYSFQYPAILATINKSKRMTTTLHDLRELKYLINHYKDSIDQEVIGLHKTVIADMLDHVTLHYLHSKPDIHEEIDLSSTIDNFEKNLYSTIKTDKNNKISYSGAFLRGCIGIVNKSAIPSGGHD